MQGLSAEVPLSVTRQGPDRDIRIGIMFSIPAFQERRQFGQQFLWQLAFNSKLLPNRHLHLAR